LVWDDLLLLLFLSSEGGIIFFFLNLASSCWTAFLFVTIWTTVRKYWQVWPHHYDHCIFFSI